ncbi:MAG TPA: clostripain-related cysteine peptidase [Candidatus Wallbacteria bacterium]|nr:clostripain-related cysteine peptidase [Candidatus Wallbacteria bacterium]
MVKKNNLAAAFFSIILIQIFSAGLCFAAAGGTAKAVKKWTFMVYMCADNDLDARGPEDIAELEQAGSSESANILVQLDRANGPARRYYITKRSAESALDDWGTASKIEKELGEVDMGDYKQLADFFKWSAENYPAERYALVIWNHGSGWKSPARAAGATDPRKRGIAFDFDSKNDISTPELGEAMRAAGAVISKKVDILFMDACLMQMMEIAYEVKDGVSYICASEDIEPDSGMPYLPVCEAINANPRISARALCVMAAGAFADKFIKTGTPYTYSAVDCSRIEELKNALDDFCAHVILEKEKLGAHLKASSSAAQRFTYRDYADCGDFITRVSQAGGETLQLKCSQVKAAYMKCVVSNKTQGEALKNSTGISIYLPLTHIKKAYAALKFASQSLWDEMLREALQLKEGW